VEEDKGEEFEIYISIRNHVRTFILPIFIFISWQRGWNICNDFMQVPIRRGKLILE